MTDMKKLGAVAWAAHQAGKSYGMFVNGISSIKLETIYGDYMAMKAEKRMAARLAAHEAAKRKHKKN